MILQITGAMPIKDYIMILKFNDEKVVQFDFSMLFKYKIFEELRDMDKFMDFKIENGVLEWGIGVDIAPEFIYEHGISIEIFPSFYYENNTPFMLRIIYAKYIKDFVLRLTFNDGKIKDVDFSEIFNSERFAHLKKHDNFVQYALTYHTIEWYDGTDFTPEFLYEKGISI
ncbi:DUF2442 domain-containing protein [Ornithobacterium rhinotracheale]|uniref:DUF2442 domain-containing protein n=1 Tax=Ornithobacterium rhinotracheale TaxID=28251 RepID=UPI00129C7F09|nr:DUF2442 domain-containing protein [Ornithobacterium rhinotracheale]MRI62446.1 DUF2442 domain-containing protein [Ornithobacterium rhinotracheale]